MQTVLLGENAAGKSNFLEALVIIFRDLELGVATPFDYTIDYQCKGQHLRAEGGPGTTGGFKILEGSSVKSKMIQLEFCIA